jgi:HAD superfamily hydrolase (TIGR01549 family)
MSCEPVSRREGLRNPLDQSSRIRAVLFDLDGTLYRQRPLRVLMAMELATLPLSGPMRALKRLRALSAYRRAQEHLRAQAAAAPATSQLDRAAREASLPLEEVEVLVEEWMYQRPLKYLRLLRSPGVAEVLDLLDRAQVPAGILSDYPAAAKLRALDLDGRFSPVLTSSDPAINVFKPHPRGFLRACECWNLPPGEVLMVGDRDDADAAGAAAAGMPCVIIGQRRSSSRYLALPSFERLSRAIDDRATN